MANLYGPRIVTDGLVLHLDAGNRKSYPLSGNTIYDLSGNGNNGTFGASTAAPTFSGDNGGNILYDGNDYIEVSYSGNFLTQSYTMSFFAKHNGSRDNRRTMLGFSNGGDFAYKTYCMQIWDSDVQFFAFIGNSAGQFNDYSFNLPDAFSNWHYFTSIITPSTVTTYVNDTIYYNNSITRRGAFDRIWIGTRGGQEWKGWIPGLTLYDRVLYDYEVKQNYNAIKGRFGL